MELTSPKNQRKINIFTFISFILSWNRYRWSDKIEKIAKYYDYRNEVSSNANGKFRRKKKT